jgi:hypothetical protein
VLENKNNQLKEVKKCRVDGIKSSMRTTKQTAARIA